MTMSFILIGKSQNVIWLYKWLVSNAMHWRWCVYAYNVFDEGFDRNNEIKNHVEKEHKDIQVQIRKDIHKEHKSVSDSSNTDESYGEAWLAKHDNDGNFIG